MLTASSQAQYLARIGVTGPVGAPSADSLRALVRAHLLAVPFENLDVVFGRPIRYELPALLEKIVERRRGGWCYELNLLFLSLLRSLGFEADLASARVIRDGERSPEFDHVTILVRLPEEGLWLADVGYGDMLPALPVREGAEQDCGDRRVRLREVPEEPSTWAVEREIAGSVTRRCTFTTQPRPFDHFLERSDFQQVSPASLFHRRLVVSKPLPAGGMATVLDGTLLVAIGANTTGCPLGSSEQVCAALRDGFGLDVPQEEAEALFARFSAPATAPA